MSGSLHCLDGAAPPEGLGADLGVLARLPDRARARFWDALGPALEEPLPPSAAASLDEFTRAHQVSSEDLGRALKAARFLVREAGARGLDAHHFEEDVVGLLGGARSPAAVVVAPLLLSRYEAVRAAMRRDIVRASVTDHGAVLTSIEWRVDAMLCSSRGDAGGARVGILTLTYREGGADERLTLQVSPDKLEELRRACERMIR